jgi:hypothetical protein
MASKFIAYPNSPAEIGATISGAIDQLRKYAQGTQIMPWAEMDIAGHFLAHEILEQIEKGDISTLNFNVTFETGYAIGCGKRVLLTKLESVADNSREISELGLFDTIGWKGYQNQREFSLIVEALSSARPIEFDPTKISKQTPLYVLDGKYS